MAQYGALGVVFKPPARVGYWWKITNKHQKIKLSQENNKLVFRSSVIETKGFGCFWDTFGGVWGPPGTQLGGEMPYCGNMWVFTPLLSAWGPSNPTKSVPKAAKPLSYDNRGMKNKFVNLFWQLYFLVFISDFSPISDSGGGFKHHPPGPILGQIS